MAYLIAICYLFSLVSYGVGYSEKSAIKNAVIDNLNNSDYNIHISLATSYFVLAIFLAVIGFFLFSVKTFRERESKETNDIISRREASGESIDRRRVC